MQNPYTRRVSRAGRPPASPVAFEAEECAKGYGMSVVGASSGWTIGLVLGVLVVLTAAAIVITILALAMRIARQAGDAVAGVEKVREQTTALDGVAQINDSGARSLHAARALRKVAGGR